MYQVLNVLILMKIDYKIRFKSCRSQDTRVQKQYFIDMSQTIDVPSIKRAYFNED